MYLQDTWFVTSEWIHSPAHKTHTCRPHQASIHTISHTASAKKRNKTRKLRSFCDGLKFNEPRASTVKPFPPIKSQINKAKRWHKKQSISQGTRLHLTTFECTFDHSNPHLGFQDALISQKRYLKIRLYASGIWNFATIDSDLKHFPGKLFVSEIMRN